MDVHRTHTTAIESRYVPNSIIITAYYVGINLFLDSEVRHGWNDSFWQAIGLGELVSESYARIGNDMQVPGLPVGRGLEAGAARELGLPAGTPVATAIIDAHAGGIGKDRQFCLYMCACSTSIYTRVLS